MACPTRTVAAPTTRYYISFDRVRFLFRRRDGHASYRRPGTITSRVAHTKRRGPPQAARTMVTATAGKRDGLCAHPARRLPGPVERSTTATTPSTRTRYRQVNHPRLAVPAMRAFATRHPPSRVPPRLSHVCRQRARSSARAGTRRARGPMAARAGCRAINRASERYRGGAGLVAMGGIEPPTSAL